MNEDVNLFRNCIYLMSNKLIIDVVSNLDEIFRKPIEFLYKIKSDQINQK